MPLRLIAHQGGWDEVLLLVLPAVAMILWVRWAERRSRTRREQEPPAPPTNIAADADD